MIRLRPPTEFGQLDTTPTSRHLQSPDKLEGQQTVSPSRARENDNLPATQLFDWDGIAGRTQSSLSFDGFDDGIDDVDLIKFDTTEAQAEPLREADKDGWSELGSLTRRSTPVAGGETPRDLWEFGTQDSRRDALSSPRSGQEKLPDTLPLPPEHLRTALGGDGQGVDCKRVDFSETASTARRSSPFTSYAATSQIAMDEAWEPREGTPLAIPVAQALAYELPQTAPLELDSPVDRVSDDNIYDATPPRSSGRRPTAPPKRHSSVIGNVPDRRDTTSAQPSRRKQASKVTAQTAKKTQGPRSNVLREEETGFEKEGLQPSLPKQTKSSTARQKVDEKSPRQAPGPATEKQVSPKAADDSAIGSASKGKKRKQRAKTPVQFDDATNEIKEIPVPKTNPAPTRMPIVSKLRQMAAKSSSSTTRAKKRTPKTTRKAPPKAAPQTTPPKTAAPRTAPKDAPMDAPTDAPKAAPVVAAEPPPKAPPGATSKETPQSKPRAEPPQKKRKVTFKEDHDDGSCIVVNTDKITDQPPAFSTRSKAQKESKKKPSPRQEKVQGRSEPQESTATHATQETIVLSSDSDDSISLLLEEYQREDTPRLPEGLQGQELVVDSNADSTAPPATPLRDEQEKQLEVTQDPAPRPSGPAQLLNTLEMVGVPLAKASAESTIPAEGPSRATKKARTVKTDHSTALSPRDANIISKRPLRTAQGPVPSVLTKGISTSRQEEVLAQPTRRTSTISRNFSISEMGSPVPHETGQLALGAEASPQDDESLETVNEQIGHRQQPGPRRSRRRRRLVE
ncbi:hypothetical protein ACJ41O_007696 [Fusarium nematophilum]